MAIEEARVVPFSAVDLRCSSCGGAFDFRATPSQPLAGGVFGILGCSCGRHPVVDSIPVLREGRVDVQDHMTGRAEVEGPTTARLVELLDADRGLDALVELLAFPPPVPLGLGTRRGVRLPFTRGPWPLLAMRARRAEVRAMLGRLGALTAQDWMELCYLRSSDRTSGEMFPYFFVRFGQPRYLSSIQFLRALPTPAERGEDRPILDLACGFGHLMYHLAERADPVRSVGVDRNFFQLWVARRYVATASSYVCSDRVDRLPFPDDAFAASVCTDAFHLFDVQQESMDELRRVAVADTVLLDRVGNRLLEPTDTPEERTPTGYADLVRGAPVRLTSEDELLPAYRAGRGLRLVDRDPAELDEHKWLAMITTTDAGLFRDEPDRDDLPHGAGALRINPIYRIDRDGDDVHLRFEYPSTWYAFENSLMTTFTSAGEHLAPDEFAAVAAGDEVARTPFFLRRFVVLGMPPTYARSPASTTRPPSVAAGLLEGVRHEWRHRRGAHPR